MEEKTCFIEENLGLLLKKYIQNALVLEKQGLVSWLTKIGKEKGIMRYILPLKINPLNQKLIDEKTQNFHWIGLEITCKEEKITVKYVDPMGFKLSDELREFIKKSLNTTRKIEMQEPFLNEPIQFARRTSDSQLEGNLSGSAPFLIYLMACLDKERKIVASNDKETSDHLEKYLRENFKKISDFEEIFDNFPLKQHKITKVSNDCLEKFLIEEMKVKKENDNFDLDKMLLLLLKSNTQINIKGKDIVFFFGYTGEGKSTIINYLANKKIIEKQETVERNFNGTLIRTKKTVYDFENPLQNIQVGHFKHSQTGHFCYYEDEKNGVLLCDSPGFSTTVGKEQEVASSISISEICQQSASIVPVLIISFSQLEVERGRGVKELVKIIFNLFDDFEKAKESLMIVFTKTKERTLDNVLDQTLELYEELTDENEKKVYTFIISNIQENTGKIKILDISLKQLPKPIEFISCIEKCKKLEASQFQYRTSKDYYLDFIKTSSLCCHKFLFPKNLISLLSNEKHNNEISKALNCLEFMKIITNKYTHLKEETNYKSLLEELRNQWNPEFKKHVDIFNKFCEDKNTTITYSRFVKAMSIITSIPLLFGDLITVNFSNQLETVKKSLKNYFNTWLNYFSNKQEKPATHLIHILQSCSGVEELKIPIKEFIQTAQQKLKSLGYSYSDKSFEEVCQNIISLKKLKSFSLFDTEEFCAKIIYMRVKKKYREYFDNTIQLFYEILSQDKIMAAGTFYDRLKKLEKLHFLFEDYYAKVTKAGEDFQLMNNNWELKTIPEDIKDRLLLISNFNQSSEIQNFQKETNTLDVAPKDRSPIKQTPQTINLSSKQYETPFSGYGKRRWLKHRVNETINKTIFRSEDLLETENEIINRISTITKTEETKHYFEEVYKKTDRGKTKYSRARIDRKEIRPLSTIEEHEDIIKKKDGSSYSTEEKEIGKVDDTNVKFSSEVTEKLRISCITTDNTNNQSISNIIEEKDIGKYKVDSTKKNFQTLEHGIKNEIEKIYRTARYEGTFEQNNGIQVKTTEHDSKSFNKMTIKTEYSTETETSQFENHNDIHREATSKNTTFFDIIKKTKSTVKTNTNFFLKTTEIIKEELKEGEIESNSEIKTELSNPGQVAISSATGAIMSLLIKWLETKKFPDTVELAQCGLNVTSDTFVAFSKDIMSQIDVNFDAVHLGAVAILISAFSQSISKDKAKNDLQKKVDSIKQTTKITLNLLYFAYKFKDTPGILMAGGLIIDLLGDCYQLFTDKQKIKWSDKFKIICQKSGYRIAGLLGGMAGNYGVTSLLSYYGIASSATIGASVATTILPAVGFVVVAYLIGKFVNSIGAFYSKYQLQNELKELSKKYELKIDVTEKLLGKKLRELMKKYHPDRFLEEQEKKEATAKFREVVDDFKKIPAIRSQLTKSITTFELKLFTLLDLLFYTTELSSDAFSYLRLFLRTV